MGSKGASTEAPASFPQVLGLLITKKRFKKLVQHLDTPIVDLFNLARTCKTIWEQISQEQAFWRALYLEEDPLITREIKKRLENDSYCKKAGQVYSFQRCGIKQCAWMRAAVLLYAKPKLILVLAGTDPIMVRRLGEPESMAVAVNLGINYHLDSYLDEDAQRFAVEFPQILQDLEYGDLVVTRDFKGMGCWTAVPDPASAPFLKLRKNGIDSGGLGILAKDLAPPFFPLLYYCDVTLQEARELGAAGLKRKQVYWFTYTLMADNSMYSWGDHELLAAL